MVTSENHGSLSPDLPYDADFFVWAAAISSASMIGEGY